MRRRCVVRKGMKRGEIKLGKFDGGELIVPDIGPREQAMHSMFTDGMKHDDGDMKNQQVLRLLGNLLNRDESRGSDEIWKTREKSLGERRKCSRLNWKLVD